MVAQMKNGEETEYFAKWHDKHRKLDLRKHTLVIFKEFRVKQAEEAEKIHH